MLKTQRARKFVTSLKMFTRNAIETPVRRAVNEDVRMRLNTIRRVIKAEKSFAAVPIRKTLCISAVLWKKDAAHGRQPSSSRSFRPDRPT